MWGCLNWDSWDSVVWVLSELGFLGFCRGILGISVLVLGWGVFVCPLSCGCLWMGILPLRLFKGAGLASSFGFLLRRHQM